MLAFTVVLIVVGLIVGLIVRLLVPGRDDIGIGTILLGIIGSILGAIMVLLILRVTGLERGHGRSRSGLAPRSARRRWI